MTSLADITIRSYPHTIRMMGIFGLLWFGVLAIPLEDPKIVVFYSLTYIAIVSGVTGDSLRVRLSSPRAHTTPDYRGVHIAIALGWCALTLIVSAGINVFRGIPPMPLVLWLWSFSLLVLLVGYAFPVMSVRMPWTKVQLLTLLPACGTLVFLAILVMKAPFPIPIVACLIGGAALIWFSYYRWCNAEIE